MKTAILGLFAETSIHPGNGQNMGVVDLPVAREGATGYPVIVGSSMKGALRDKTRAMDGTPRGKESAGTKRLFGTQEAAAGISVTDARLALLPLRSLSGHYKWAICPYIIERLQRDCQRMGYDYDSPKITVKEDQALVAEGEGILFLEELSFSKSPDPSLPSVGEVLAWLMPNQRLRDRLLSQLVIISDNQFSYFAQHGLPVNARNVLDDGKKSTNLWYEESLPPDSLFYTLLISRDDEDLAAVRELFASQPYLQVGGNETIGYGWFKITWVDKLGRG